MARREYLRARERFRPYLGGGVGGTGLPGPSGFGYGPGLPGLSPIFHHLLSEIRSKMRRTDDHLHQKKREDESERCQPLGLFLPLECWRLPLGLGCLRGITPPFVKVRTVCTI